MTPQGRNQDLDPFVLGLLADGSEGVVRTALAALFSRGAIQFAVWTIFRVREEEGLSGIVQKVSEAARPEGGSMRALVAAVGSSVAEVNQRAKAHGLIMRLPWVVLTREGRRTLAWHRAQAQELLVKGRESGLRSFTPREAARAAALFATVSTERGWADPRWASRTSDPVPNGFDEPGPPRGSPYGWP